MMLVDAYTIDRMEALETLFRLLSERTPNQSISHKQMPTWDQSAAFFDSRPPAPEEAEAFLEALAAASAGEGAP